MQYHCLGTTADGHNTTSTSIILLGQTSTFRANYNYPDKNHNSYEQAESERGFSTVGKQASGVIQAAFQHGRLSLYQACIICTIGRIRQRLSLIPQHYWCVNIGAINYSSMI